MEPQDEDGNYYRELARGQKEKLLKLADICERHLEVGCSIPDEQKGLLRSASGKARLLVTERFNQFDGLCQSNLSPIQGEFTIGPKDLAGFWDLIMIEVRSLHSTFHQLAEMAKNNWIVPVEEANQNEDHQPKAAKRPPEKAKRATTRKSIIESRKPLRLVKQNSDPAIRELKVDESRKMSSPQLL